MTPATRDPDSRDGIAAAVRAVHNDECAAMVRGDAAALGGLLAEGFTLTHMTGYVQSKADWLQDVGTGQMQYHSMEQVGGIVEFEVATPVLSARTLTEATIWGSHGTWRLHLRSWFEATDRGWVVCRTVASTW